MARPKGIPSNRKGKTLEELFGKEKADIWKLNNKQNQLGKKRSSESIEKQRKSIILAHKLKIFGYKIGQNIGDKNPAKRPEVRKKISDKAKYRGGYKLSNEHKKKLSIINKDRWKYQIKKINCIICGTEKQVKPSQKNPTFCSRKCFGEWKKVNFCSENNPNWIDGRSFEAYAPEFNKKLKERIKNRDKYTCQLCSDKIEKQTQKRFMTVHHIDYNKQNCDEQNLITLCNLCNSSVNSSRDEWKNLFNKKMEMIYNG